MNETELAISIVLAFTAALTTSAALYNRYQRANRTRKVRAAKVRQLISRCCETLDDLPPAYLMPALRTTLCKLARCWTENLTRLQPSDASIPTLLESLAELEGRKERDHAMAHGTALPASERKSAAQALHNAKVLVQSAAAETVLTNAERHQALAVANALLFKTSIDHLRSNAANAEKIGLSNEAIGYLQRARSELLESDPAKYANEVREVEAEIARLSQSGPATKSESGAANTEGTLLAALQAEDAAEVDHFSWQRGAASTDLKSTSTHITSNRD